MVQYQDEHFFFSASSLEATFSDGSTLDESQVSFTVRTGTPLGDELCILDKGDPSWYNASEVDGMNHFSGQRRIIRLIVIPPSMDWRNRNQDDVHYAWKMDSAWMSDPSDRADDEQDMSIDWLHWNVESYIDSVIQAPTNNTLLEIDQIELHFRPIRGRKNINNDNIASSPFVSTHHEQLIMRKVQMGWNIPASQDIASMDVVLPCSNNRRGTICSVLDGQITSGEGTLSRSWFKRTHNLHIFTTRRGINSGFTGLFIFVGIGCFVLAMKRWCRQRRSSLYRELASNEDLTLTESGEENDRDPNTHHTIQNG